MTGKLTKSCGREYRKRETFVGSRREAEDRYAQIRAELKAATGSEPLAIETFGQVLDRYFEEKGGLHRNDHSRFVQLRLDLGTVKMRDLPERLHQHIQYLRNTPSAQTGRKLSVGSINKYLMWTKAALNLAVRQGKLDKNPITSYNFPRRKETPRDTILTEEQILKLFEVIDQDADHLRAIVQYALEIPCRKSELVNMRREDLHLNAVEPYIRVRNGKTKNGIGIKKNIPEYMLEYFRTLPPETEYLFYRQEKDGTCHPLGDFKRAWKSCLRKAGIQDFRFHDTRHVSATRMADENVPERVIMEIAGWLTPMLKNYYKRDSSKALRLARIAPISSKLGAPRHPTSHAKVDTLVDTEK